MFAFVCLKHNSNRRLNPKFKNNVDDYYLNYNQGDKLSKVFVF